MSKKFVLKRLNEGRKNAVGKIVIVDREKGSTGYIEDMNYNGIIQPSVVKLSDEDAWSLFKGNEWTFATVNRIVRDCVKAKPKVVPANESDKISGRLKGRIEIIENFLKNPNDNKESFAEIREKVILNMLVYGRGVIEKVLDQTSRALLEIYAQDPKYIKIKADIHGNLPSAGAYVLDPPLNKNKRPNNDNTGNGVVKYDLDEIIFMVLNSNTESMYGLKILDVIANAVASDILRGSYNSNFFTNGAEASGIISLDGMSRPNLEKFRSDWRAQFRSYKNSHKIAMVNVPIKYVKMALSNRDLQFGEYGIELRSKIFAAFGMQPFIMGIVDGTTGKLNSGQQVESYKDAAIRPILSKESFYYTQEIIQMGFGFKDVKIIFPTIDLSDMQTQAGLDREDVNSCILTINEVRARRGMSPVPWGEAPLTTPGGGQIDPKTGRVIPPSAQGGVASKPTPKKTFEEFKSDLLCGLALREPERTMVIKMHLEDNGFTKQQVEILTVAILETENNQQLDDLIDEFKW